MDKDEMLTLTEQKEQFMLHYRYDWDIDEKRLMEQIISENNKWFHWPQWYDWLVNRKDISKDNIEYRKRVEQRAIKLEEMERARQEERERERARQAEIRQGLISNKAANSRFNPYKR